MNTRDRFNIIIGVLLCAMLSLQLSAGQETVAPVLAAMRRADPAIQFAGLLAQVPDAGGMALSLVVGSSISARPRAVDGSFQWVPSDTLSLLSGDNGSSNYRILKSYRHNSANCCAVRVLRAGSTEFVLARAGEKNEIRPNLKIWIDAKTGSVTSSEYMPFSIQNVRLDADVPVFTAGDGSQFLSIFATAMAPFLQLIPGQASPPVRSATVVPSALFGARSPALPQSSYPEFAAARPARAADGYRSDNTKIQETIGPVQIVGTRAWLGKSFDDAEGRSGVGAFGYLDSTEGRYHLFSPPEIRDWSVSAIRIEDGVAWLGLTSRGEWGDSPGGLLRVDLQTMQVKKYDVKGTVNDIVRYQGLLYLATSEGVSLILSDDSIQNVFVDMAADRSWQLSRTTP